ncbi:MAG: preprotein translocase subunit YajC [Bacteroidaceae bacterium]|nr:preprotein translocase subunit YajC [Bacteroidaceae bacterium]MBR1801317.1 preprotein translocase subunit YajC [Bacteroidaceae bacterium]
MQALTILLQAQGDGGMGMILMLVAMFAIMYFFMIRPQQKKQKEIQNFRKSIEKGQEVITAGGLYGVVRDIDDVNNVLVLEVANGVRVRVDRNSVFASAASTENYTK